MGAVIFLLSNVFVNFVPHPSSVEDEKHFILHCPKYQNIRNSYNTLFQSIRTDDDLIREILDPKDLIGVHQDNTV
jgi:hypothetical protein